MSRPYFRSAIKELLQIFEEHSDDPATLQTLRDELLHRKTSKAIALLKQVEELLDKNDSSPNPSVSAVPDNQAFLEFGSDSPKPMPEPGLGTPSKNDDREAVQTASQQNYELKPQPDRKLPEVFKSISAPGCSGKPDPWIPNLKNDLILDVPVGAGNCKRFALVLEALIAEMKQGGSGQSRHELKDGHFLSGTGNQFLYGFVFASEADIFEDAVIELEIGGRRISGHIVSISDGKIVVAIDDEQGPFIKHCVLLIDNTAIIEALKEKLLQADKGELAFSKEIADLVFSKARQAEKASSFKIPEHNLSAAKQPALQTMASNKVSYLWGPPGTGKTETLAVIVQAAFEAGNRVLICSNTNQAVDQLICKLAKRLRVISHSALSEGRIVRPGNIVLPELLNDFEPYVTIDGIAKRLGSELEEQRTSLQQEISILDNNLASAEKILSKFHELDFKKEEVQSLEAEISKTASEYQRSVLGLEQNENRLRDLHAELNKSESANALQKIFLRKKETILREIRRAESQVENHQSARDKLHDIANDLQARFSSARQNLAEQEVNLKQHDRKKLESTKEAMEVKRRELVAELRVVEAKLAEMEASILQGALVIGTTIARSYLRAADLGQFDTVIVDEASMVLIPALYFAAGMSKERVIVSGDFRQLPPIVPSIQQAIHDAIGNDVFHAAGIDGLSKDPRYEMLSEQFRMDNSICELVTHDMYKGKLKTSKERAPGELIDLPDPIDQNLVIIDTSRLWPFESQNIFKSRFNLLNALLVRNLIQHLSDSGFVRDSSMAGVCTPYAAQASLLQKILRSNSLDEHVSAGTVHRYQGDEKQLMILDIPESIGPAWSIGLFTQGVPPESTGSRLMNVAISRAKENLIVIANLTYLEDMLPGTAFLRSVLYNMQENGTVVDATEVLALNPVQPDLTDLLNIVELDLDAKKLGLFHSRSFEEVCMQDMLCANESIVMFSGFITPQRVSKYGELFRSKLAEGVKIRCITRPPHRNGSMPFESGRQALDALESLGVVIDCRNKIHEKVVILDNKIVWSGSLNPLSHTAETDEFMTRVVGQEYAEQVALFLSKRSSLRLGDIGNTSTEAENPRCPNCEGRTWYAEGRYGPYYGCENVNDCGWKESAHNASKSTRDPDPVSNSKDGPACPECKGVTRLRKGRYGPFYGCANYPKCKGTVKIPKKR